jgi:hypothetical protein
MRPGDVALERGHTLVGFLIRLGTRSRVNHAKLVVSEDGRCLSANADGADYEYVKPSDIIVSAPLTDDQRAMIPAIADHLAGTPYGYLDCAALGLAQLGITLPSVKRRLARPDRLFCSQLVDYAWQLVGFHAFNDLRPPQDVSPGDLADLAFTAGWSLVQRPSGWRVHQ